MLNEYLVYRVTILPQGVGISMLISHIPMGTKPIKVGFRA